MDQRDAERGAIAVLEGIRPGVGVFIPFGEDVGDVNRSPVDHDTPRNAPTHKRYRELSNRTC